MPITGSKMADGNVVALPFVVANLAASQTDAALEASAVGVVGVTGIVMPAAGYIVGLAVESNAARTAGTADFRPSVAGTAVSGAAATDLQAILDATNTTRVTSRATVRNVATFTAGQRVGVVVTTDGTWAPITADILVTLFVGLERVCDSS